MTQQSGIHSPFPCKVLSNDRNESLETSEDRAMDNHRSCGGFVRTLGIFGRTVLQVETFRKLEIELNGCALEGPPECVSDGDINFGSVERTISGIDFPFTRVLIFECFFELLQRIMGNEPTCSDPSKKGRLAASAWSQVSIVPK